MNLGLDSLMGPTPFGTAIEMASLLRGRPRGPCDVSARGSPILPAARPLRFYAAESQEKRVSQRMCGTVRRASMNDEREDRCLIT